MNDVEKLDKSAEKRKLETAHYEESVMAMKCRKFEKGASYQTLKSEND